MQCEKCGQELETIVCRGCGKSVTALGAFCYLCGQRLSGQEGSRSEAGDRPVGVDTDAGEIDFSSRILCSDGACIGVINEHGICKVCGKPYEQEKE